MQRALLITAILTVFSTIIFLPAPARAATYDIGLYDADNNLLGTPDSPPVSDIKIGTSLIANFTTDSTEIQSVMIQWIRPDGSIILQETHDDLDDATVITSFTSSSFSPESSGNWIVRVIARNYTTTNNPDSEFIRTHFVSSQDIPFTVESILVIPESPIGMVALLASSFLALGGFMFWKRKTKPLYTGMVLVLRCSCSNFLVALA